MELSFIWVKEFRNIRNQGFNISSRYIFDFNSETKRLNFRPNPKHINNFFGNGISNITGIVGQNGAGKTNLLELINYVLNEGNTKIDKSFFIVYEIAPGQFKGFQHQIEVMYSVDNYEINFDPYLKNNPFFDVIHFSNAFDGRKHDLSENTFDLSSNRFLINQFGENFLKLFYSDVQTQIKFLGSENFELLSNVERGITGESNHLFPNRIKLISPTWGNILHRSKSFDLLITKLRPIRSEGNLLKQFCSAYRKKINDNQSDNSIIYFTAFLIFIDYLLNVLTPIYQERLKTGDSLENRVAEELDQILDIIVTLGTSRIDEIHRSITRDITSIIDNNNPYVEERLRFLTELGEFEFNGVIKTNEGTYSNRKVQFSIPYSIDIGRFVNKYIQATSNQSLTYNIEWEGISTGHRAFLSLFSRFHSIIKKLQKQDVFITIDEGDLYFHPKWQVEFLYRLIKVLPPLLAKSSIQIVLTTHSPFLVSDLLKSNLIFLKKDQRGDCKVIPSEQIEGDTFGGNVGELYLDAFFLKDKFISHFAREKIIQLVESIESEKESGIISEDSRKLLNQLGEVLIKNKIEQLLNDSN